MDKIQVWYLFIGANVFGFFSFFFKSAINKPTNERNLFECDVQYFILYKVTSEMDD